jgi:uncharacterized protein
VPVCRTPALSLGKTAPQCDDPRCAENGAMNALFPLGWAHYLLGGLVIGSGVALLYLVTGRLAGMSSVFTSSWSYVSSRAFFRQPRWLESRAWRLQLALGLVLGAALWWWTLGPAAPLTTEVPTWRLLLGGVVAGYGARLSGGCTSGHGICGIASLKLPSLLAVLTFMATGFATAMGLAALGVAP